MYILNIHDLLEEYKLMEPVVYYLGYPSEHNMESAEAGCGKLNYISANQ